MTPAQVVSDLLLSELRANGGISADTAQDPTGLPGVYAVTIPQGESFLPAVVYTLTPSADNAPQGQSQMSYFEAVVLAVASGQSWKHSLAQDSVDALHGYVGESQGYAISIARSGDVAPYVQRLEGKDYRAVGVRFTIRVSHPL